jgi:hypothetical protein
MRPDKILLNSIFMLHRPSTKVGGFTDPPRIALTSLPPINISFIFHVHSAEYRITRSHNDNNGKQICEHIALFLLRHIG